MSQTDLPSSSGPNPAKRASLKRSKSSDSMHASSVVSSKGEKISSRRSPGDATNSAGDLVGSQGGLVKSDSQSSLKKSSRGDEQKGKSRKEKEKKRPDDSITLSAQSIDNMESKLQALGITKEGKKKDKGKEKSDASAEERASPSKEKEGSRKKEKLQRSVTDNAKERRDRTKKSRSGSTTSTNPHEATQATSTASTANASPGSASAEFERILYAKDDPQASGANAAKKPREHARSKRSASHNQDDEDMKLLNLDIGLSLLNDFTTSSESRDDAKPDDLSLSSPPVREVPISPRPALIPIVTGALAENADEDLIGPVSVRRLEPETKAVEPLSSTEGAVHDMEHEGERKKKREALNDTHHAPRTFAETATISTSTDIRPTDSNNSSESNSLASEKDGPDRKPARKVSLRLNANVVQSAMTDSGSSVGEKEREKSDRSAKSENRGSSSRKNPSDEKTPENDALGSSANGMNSSTSSVAGKRPGRKVSTNAQAGASGNYSTLQYEKKQHRSSASSSKDTSSLKGDGASSHSHSSSRTKALQAAALVAKEQEKHVPDLHEQMQTIELLHESGKMPSVTVSLSPRTSEECSSPGGTLGRSKEGPMRKDSTGSRKESPRDKTLRRDSREALALPKLGASQNATNASPRPTSLFTSSGSPSQSPKKRSHSFGETEHVPIGGSPKRLGGGSGGGGGGDGEGLLEAAMHGDRPLHHARSFNDIPRGHEDAPNEGNAPPSTKISSLSSAFADKRVSKSSPKMVGTHSHQITGAGSLVSPGRNFSLNSPTSINSPDGRHHVSVSGPVMHVQKAPKVDVEALLSPRRSGDERTLPFRDRTKKQERRGTQEPNRSSTSLAGDDFSDKSALAIKREKMKKRASENIQSRRPAEMGGHNKADTCPANLEMFAISQIQHRLRESKVNASLKVIALFYDRSGQNIDIATQKTKQHLEWLQEQGYFGFDFENPVSFDQLVKARTHESPNIVSMHVTRHLAFEPKSSFDNEGRITIFVQQKHFLSKQPDLLHHQTMLYWWAYDLINQHSIDILVKGLCFVVDMKDTSFENYSFDREEQLSLFSLMKQFPLRISKVMIVNRNYLNDSIAAFLGTLFEKPCMGNVSYVTQAELTNHFPSSIIPNSLGGQWHYNYDDTWSLDLPTFLNRPELVKDWLENCRRSPPLGTNIIW